MNILESFRVALGMLALHKFRAFLTMLGVIIGVMSVSLVMEVSSGFQHLLTDQIKQLGSDTFFIFYDSGRDMRSGRGSIDKLTMEDITFITNHATTVDIASGVQMIGGQPLRRQDREVKDPRILATDEHQAELSKVEMKSGRQLSKEDLDTLANVCVIGTECATRLFGDVDPIGKSVNFPGLTLEVIGVMNPIDIMGQSTSKDVWIPISTAQKKWVGGDSVTMITCRAKQGVTPEESMDDVWRALMLRSGNKPVYRVDSRESIIKVLGVVVGSAGAVLAAVAALSLLVGGIGIMNIMLVSVTERTREIGLRKAVGARRAAILTQFLVESALLSLVGGLIGMFIAFIIGQSVTLLTMRMKWPNEGGFLMPFDLVGAFIAAAFSALIGMVFGIYPAARAAQLSPIEALRSE